MMKKLALSLVLFLTLFFTIPVFYLINSQQQITITDKKVVYELPYPGLLPDHPLYIMKAVRDRILDFFTRDNLKKAELYLLFSDKRAKMAEQLAKRGKSKLAISTFSKGEKYFLKIVDHVKQAKQQGKAPLADLVEKLRQSNAKHRAVLNQLLKDLPQGEQEGLSEVMRINEEIRVGLDAL
ncbi:hypothetical protein HYT33_03000 [Candidatus Roizmanbacteria bacterium]|nr:hypothetical protein [Candidatus Roizmanbacteria bacterium]